jgi:beta-galactosidase/beta-glucuronidase
MRGICRLLPVIGSLVSAVLGIQMANADTFARDIPGPDTVFVEKTSTRMDVCLNGKWSFRPADESKLPPSEGWGQVSVPSTWDSDWPIVTMAEDGSHFPMDELRKSASAWYQRRVVIPAEADGKRVAVDLRDVSGLATVSIDGKEVGQTRDSGRTAGAASVTSPYAPL